MKCPFATNNDTPDAPPYEHMWLNQIDFDGETVTGTLANEPHWIDNLNAGDIVSIPLSDISDWLYVSQGKAYGGYSVHVMRRAMNKNERAKHDAAWGFEFGHPDQILVTPYTQQKTKTFISKLFASSKHDNSEIPEHPMSENMAENIEKVLIEQPNVVHDKDHEGWTMLHREVLAGNLTPVNLLIRYGANIHELNRKGQSVLDIAKSMRWDKIILMLEKSV